MKYGIESLSTSDTAGGAGGGQNPAFLPSPTKKQQAYYREYFQNDKGQIDVQQYGQDNIPSDAANSI